MSYPYQMPATPQLPPNNYGTGQKPQRSVWWLIGIALVGWTILAYPIALALVVLHTILTSTAQGSNPLTMFFGSLQSWAVLLSMIPFPVLLGLAVFKRHRGLRICAIITGTIAPASFAGLLLVMLTSSEL